MKKIKLKGQSKRKNLRQKKSKSKIELNKRGPLLRGRTKIPSRTDIFKEWAFRENLEKQESFDKSSCFKIFKLKTKENYSSIKLRVKCYFYNTQPD